MAELTDKEIVAACARAIGVQPHPMWNAAKWPTPDFFGTHGVFNPLHDRAQAMELVEMLGIAVWTSPAHFADHAGEFAWYALPRGVKASSKIMQEQVPQPNLLRAICLCAARGQIEKEKNA